MMEVVGGTQDIFRAGIYTIRTVARSPRVPTSDADIYALGEYVDAYDAKLATDHELYMQSKAKLRAAITQRLAEDLDWEGGQGGAVRDMTDEVREELLRAAEPKDPNA